MNANETVARAICQELTTLKLISQARATSLERSIGQGTITDEQWLFELETALPPGEGPNDARDAR